MFSESISITLGCSVNTDNSDLQAASFTQGQQHSLQRYVCVTQHSPSCSYVSPHGLFCAFSRSTGSGGVQHDVNSFCTSDFNIFLLHKNREDFLNLRMFLATGSTLRNLWKRDVRMYSTLPTLGDGTYGTLESNRLHLGDGMTISSVVPPISGEAWVDHLNKQGDQHLFVALTKEEFESVSASTEGVLNKLDGSVRQDKEWFQLILIVTAGDAIRTLAYHDSQGHTTRNGSTATVVAPSGSTKDQQRVDQFCSRCSQHHGTCQQRKLQHIPAWQLHGSVSSPCRASLLPECEGTEHPHCGQFGGRSVPSVWKQNVVK